MHLLDHRIMIMAAVRTVPAVRRGAVGLLVLGWFGRNRFRSRNEGLVSKQQIEGG